MKHYLSILAAVLLMSCSSDYPENTKYYKNAYGVPDLVTCVQFCLPSEVRTWSLPLQHCSCNFEYLTK